MKKLLSCMWIFCLLVLAHGTRGADLSVTGNLTVNSNAVVYGNLSVASNALVVGSLTVGGTNNTLPYQILSSSGSILTVGGGDARYASRLGMVSTGGGVAPTALGVQSVAMGYQTLASGTGDSAFGALCLSTGYVSSAMGYGAVADGMASVALGYGTRAQGTGSTSMGFGTWAQGTGQLVAGTYNVTSTDQLFVVGNGTNVNYRSNAFTVNTVGDAWLSGKLTTVGNVGIGTNAPSAKLHVNGTARFEQAVTIVPQGDLSMGAFTNSPAQ